MQRDRAGERTSMAAFVCHYHWPHICYYLPTNLDLGAFLASCISDDRDRRWTARTVSTLVAVTQKPDRSLLSVPAVAGVVIGRHGR
jgi:hypothetical protein